MDLRLLFEKEEDDKVEDPTGHFTFEGKEYPYWGNPNGAAKTVDYDVGKFNRYAMIGQNADETLADLKNIVSNERGVAGRCAFSCILMMKYGVRVGNEDSATGYESGLEKNKGDIVQTFGTTTLKNEHIKFKGNQMILDFLGKEQVEQEVVIDDPFLVEYGKKMHNPRIPEDKWIGVDYDTMFKFVKKKVGKQYVPKDFRTFCANTTGWNAMQPFLKSPLKDMKSEANKEVAEIVEIVADKLGNTPGISRRNYLDSKMLDWFADQRYEEKE